MTNSVLISMIPSQVFNRLLGTHNNESGVPHTSPITPAELLIALHNIDPIKAELKTIIKGIVHELMDHFYVVSLYGGLLIILICSYVSVFRGEASVHPGNRGRGDAASHGNDAAAHIANAYSNTKSGSVPEVKRIRHEYTSTVDPQASVETAESLGGLCKMLRTHAATEFRSYSTASPSSTG